MSKYIVNISGGAGSTIAAHRAVEMKGADNCVLVFADTGSEHETTYELIDELEFNFRFNYGMKTNRLKFHDGDIWDFFDKHGFIRHPQTGCMASFHLKQRVLDAFSAAYGADAIVVTGLDWTEEDRIERFDRKKAPVRTWHPLCEKPRLSRCQLLEEMKRLGYPDQALYERGYPHNNCGGGCVLAGIGQWAGLLADDPARFEYAAQREVQFQRLHNTDFTILKDRRGGSVKPLTLYQLKARVESGDTDGMREFRSTCSCMTDVVQ